MATEEESQGYDTVCAARHERMIDAYCHCGISKYLPVHNVRETMRFVGVERAVLCQHLGEYDNRYLASVVRASPHVYTAVGLIDSSLSGWRDLVTTLAKSDEFSGVRIPRETLIRDSNFSRSVLAEGLVMVVDASRGIGECVPVIVRLLGEIPGTIVVSHLGYPQLKRGRVTGRELFELAGVAGVYVMLSGQSMWCGYPYHPLYDFTCEVIREFGTDRVMWGSNYPVCGDAYAFRRDLKLITGGGFGLHEDDIYRITHANADRVWFA